MPITTNALKALCTRELNAENDKWEEICAASLENAFEKGAAVECRIIDEHTLQPLSYEHRFRENQEITIRLGEVDKTQNYVYAMRGSFRNDITGIDLSGNILTRNPLPKTGTAIVFDVGPLLEDYDRQRDIIEGWLQNADPTGQALTFLTMLGSAPLEEISHRDEHTAEDIYDASKNGADLLLVQGPPGCGKTWLCADLINYALKDNLSVAIFAFTNRACDQLLQTFAEKNSNMVGQVYRYGNEEARKKNLDPLGIRKGALNTRPSQAVGTTLFQATRLAHQYINVGQPLPQFDLIIVDEASQATLPMICAPLACAKKIILVGDQKQLPPVLISSPREECERELYQSAFEFLSNRHPSVFLDKTYRMRPDVCEIPSKAFYEAKLKAHNEADREPWNNTSGELALNPNPGHQLIIVEKHNLEHHSSEAEAEAIRTIIGMWEQQLRAAFKEEKMNDNLRYLISCFYRSQVNMVKQNMRDYTIHLGEGRVHVDTVERNQGQTCVIGFLSVAETGGFERGLEWSMDPRRLNVAITRARAKNYVLAPTEFVDLACSEQNPSAESKMAWQLLRAHAINWA